MRRAIELADLAAAQGETPVGAVVVQGETLVGEGGNRPIADHDPTAHAEVIALRSAAATLQNWRLDDCTLYATMEPCAMCAGAAVNARIKRLVFGTRDLRFGAVRSKFRLADSELLHHRLEITEGVLAVDCVERLQRFFRKLR